MAQLIDDILAFSDSVAMTSRLRWSTWTASFDRSPTDLMQLEQGREVRIHIEPLCEAFGDPRSCGKSGPTCCPTP